ncbi:MAG: MoaD family protein [Candidatus Verstraetearchaeota archaeon]|nr:MoaD family protein [Candidatus Verstraetearchaeota archaeon]
MKVKAEFFADLRDRVGFAVKEVEFPGNTVLELINEIDASCGGGLSGHLLEGGRLKELVKVFVNGRDVRGLGGLLTELKDGDVVSFFPPVAGG